MPGSIDDGGSDPFYVYLFGFLIFIPLLLLLLWIVGRVFGLAFFTLSALLNLLSSGKYGDMGGSSDGGRYEEDDRPTYRGGGSSGGGSYGGGGASGNW